MRPGWLSYVQVGVYYRLGDYEIYARDWMRTKFHYLSDGMDFSNEDIDERKRDRLSTTLGGA